MKTKILTKRKHEPNNLTCSCHDCMLAEDRAVEDSIYLDDEDIDDRGFEG